MSKCVFSVFLLEQTDLMAWGAPVMGDSFCPRSNMHVALLQLRVQHQHEHDETGLCVQQTNPIQVYVNNKVRSSDSDL